MFDISFAKLVVLGIVALIVLGPEKLPAVARFAGVMIGRLRQFTSNIKAEMNNQLSLTGLDNLQQKMGDLNQEIQQSLQKNLSEIREDLEEVNLAFQTEKEKVTELEKELAELKQPLRGPSAVSPEDITKQNDSEDNKQLSLFLPE